MDRFRSADWRWALAILVFACDKRTTDLQTSQAALASAPPPVASIAEAPRKPQATVTVDPQIAGKRCEQICGIGAKIKCKVPVAECHAHCLETSNAGVCQAELGRTLACVANEPPSHWECDEDGMPAIKTGFCDAEQRDFVTCATKSAEK